MSRPTDAGFGRLANEVVSGGTEHDDPPPTRAQAVTGALAWVALFVVLWMWSPWYVVFAVGLAASILLHEFGHFYTARRSGMKVTQFFLGFGPRIWSTRRDGVEYGVRAIPLGGFVKIIGMTNLDEVDPADESRTYREGSYPRRMWVITAGSVMHVVIALLLVLGVYVTAGRYQETGRVWIEWVSEDSPAERAGLQPGDVVVSVDGVAMRTETQLRALLAGTAPGTPLALSLVRDGTPVDLSVVLEQHPDHTDEVRGFLGIAPWSQDREQLGAGEALVHAPSDLVRGLGQAVVGVVKVLNPVNVTGHLFGTNTDETSRPGTIVGATRVSKGVGENDGWAGMLSLLAAVNISVGVFNMFPLLPLDGGHAAIATYERLRSRRGRRYRADAAKLMPVAAVCITLLAFMFLTGLYLDITG